MKVTLCQRAPRLPVTALITFQFHSLGVQKRVLCFMWYKINGIKNYSRQI